MPYSYPKNIPVWVKDLPKNAQKIAIRVFNKVYKKTKDEDKARQAAWSAIKEKYKKNKKGIWIKKILRNVFWIPITNDGE